MKRTILMAAIVCAALAGCATPYKPNGFAGGFSETQLAENVFRVSFRGNGYTSAERAADLSLLRSAELALQYGYSYFAIVDSNSTKDFSVYQTPSQSTTTGSATVYGNTIYGNSRTTYTPGQTMLIARPNATNTIVCFKEKPTHLAMSYDAQFLYNSLATKYDVR